MRCSRDGCATLRRNRPDDENSGFGRNAVQVYIASNPPGPARGGRQRLSVFTPLRRDEPFDDG
jgi:hypothetical protein